MGPRGGCPRSGAVCAVNRNRASGHVRLPSQPAQPPERSHVALTDPSRDPDRRRGRRKRPGRSVSRRRRTATDHDASVEVFMTAFDLRGRHRPEFESAQPWLYGIASRLLARRRPGGGGAGHARGHRPRHAAARRARRTQLRRGGVGAVAHRAHRPPGGVHRARHARAGVSCGRARARLLLDRVPGHADGARLPLL